MMRKVLWRGVALTLALAGVCWTMAQFKQCPGSAVARLLRSVVGRADVVETPPAGERQEEPAPLIVDLSAPWLKDPQALFPEDDLRLADVIHPQTKPSELDLIDLSLLSEIASPARPNYEEEDCEATTPAPATASAPAGDAAPEAPRVTLVETAATAPRYMPPCSDEEVASWVPMPYAEDLPLGIDVPQKTSSPATEEESEVIHLEEPPLCQEDPAAPYHYPGCPHIGPCPGTKNMDSPAPGTKPMPRADEPAPATDDPVGANARPASLKHHVTLKRSFVDEDIRPAHPDVDTMEFRPTDAGAADFFHQKRIY